MRSLLPMFRYALITVAILVASGCSSSDDDATATTTAEASTTVADDDEGATTEPAAETTTTVADDTESSETTETTEDATDTSTDSTDDEVGVLCSAYLESLLPAGFDSGLSTLAEVLGDDAPPGVLDAIDTLQNPDNDIEAFFSARNSIDGYVLPVCNDRFRSGIVPAVDNTAAAETFVDALRTGDRTVAERLAPTNVVVQFDWSGYPDLAADVADDATTMSMILEPTVTVFCQLDGGAVEFCAFGE